MTISFFNYPGCFRNILLYIVAPTSPATIAETFEIADIDYI